MSEKAPEKRAKPVPPGLSKVVSRVGKSGLTQLMVFLNGLILTITAFITLTVFISQMRTDDIKSLADRTRSATSFSLTRLSGAMDAASGIFVLQGQGAAGNTATRAALANIIPDKDLFDRIIWMTYNDQSRSWEAYDLYKARTRAQVPPEQYINAVLPHLRIDRSLTVFADSAERNLITTGKNPNILSKQIMIARSVISGGRMRHVMVGLTHLDVGFGGMKMLEEDGVSRFIVRDAATGNRLLQMVNPNEDGSISTPLDTAGQGWNDALGNLQMEFILDIQENGRMAFISWVPFLLLMFGLTLTMIGTLYVRSNHRQSVRLSAMNTALTSKNTELKNQIDETSRLYESMQKSEREYRGVIDSVSDIIFETDSSGNIMFVNATWEKITGFSISHSLGRDLFDMLHPADHEQQRYAFMNIVRGGEQAHRSFTRLQTADGKFRAVDLAFSQVRTDNNRNSRVVGTITDVEERRRAEKALAEAEKKYRTIVENAAGGIYQIAPDGRILSANPSLARILGYKDAFELGAHIVDFGTLYADPRDRLRYERELENLGFIRNFETGIKHRDGHTIWIAENARSVKDDDGRLLYYEGSIEDITQRKQVEQQMKEAKLHSDLANRAKSEFLANMSHELRTPLNAIIGFSEIIHNQAMGPVGLPAYVEYAGDIQDSGRRLLTVINDILDISRIEAGDRQLNETLFSLKTVSDTCVSLLSSKAEAGRITVVNNLHRDMPRIIGEELAFKQMIMNLLSNAIKFTPQDGRVTIDCAYDGTGQDMHISVTDTGVGMDDKDIEKALAPFGQVESAFSRNNSGTGLGLTLVDSLIKMHEGRFELVSRKGIGTTATIIIPAARVAQTQKTEKDLGENVALFRKSEN